MQEQEVNSRSDVTAMTSLQLGESETNNSISMSENNKFYYKSLKLYSSRSNGLKRINDNSSSSLNLNELWQQELMKMKQGEKNAIQDIKSKLPSESTQQRHKYLLQQVICPFPTSDDDDDDEMDDDKSSNSSTKADDEDKFDDNGMEDDSFEKINNRNDSHHTTIKASTTSSSSSLSLHLPDESTVKTTDIINDTLEPASEGTAVDGTKPSSSSSSKTAQQDLQVADINPLLPDPAPTPSTTIRQKLSNMALSISNVVSSAVSSNFLNSHPSSSTVTNASSSNTTTSPDITKVSLQEDSSLSVAPNTATTAAESKIVRSRYTTTNTTTTNNKGVATSTTTKATAATNKRSVCSFFTTYTTTTTPGTTAAAVGTGMTSDMAAIGLNTTTTTDDAAAIDTFSRGSKSPRLNPNSDSRTDDTCISSGSDGSVMSDNDVTVPVVTHGLVNSTVIIDQKSLLYDTAHPPTSTTTAATATSTATAAATNDILLGGGGGGKTKDKKTQPAAKRARK